MEIKRKYLTNLAIGLIGTPYIWGGNFPHEGLDCSGFVNFVYKTFELLPPGDRTAAGIFDYFNIDLVDNGRANWVKLINQITEVPFPIMQPGDLVFYGRKHISHITIYLGEIEGNPRVIGANGGNSSTVNREIAALKGARVKLAPFFYRNDILAVVGVNFG